MNSHDPEVHPVEEEEIEVSDQLETREDEASAGEGDDSAALEAEVMKWKELAMRTAADHENYRKRAAREREEAVRYSNQSLLEELLPILDNFEMGMQAASQDQSSMIYIGMDMVRKQLNEFLGSCGVTEIASEGKAFDPNVHEALMLQPSNDVPENQVLSVVQKGWKLKGKILKHARVIVSRAND